MVWVPAVIVFPQAQLKSIRSLGVVRFLKDIDRAPGQAGPAEAVGVGLPSVGVTVSLIAGFQCIYLTVFPLEFPWAAASLNVGEVLVGHACTSIQTAAFRCTRHWMKVMAAFAVATKQDPEEQARREDSHGVEAGFLDGDPAAAAGGARDRDLEDRLPP